MVGGRHAWVVLVALPLLVCVGALAQNSADDQIPIEKCDVLPVVAVNVDAKPMRFLLDTGATSILNIRSFSSGASKEIHVSSWQGTAATSAREVSIPELSLGNHKLVNLKLPAIDLSPIGKACGSPIDGILGVDLLDKMGVTIDLKWRVATLDPPDTNTHSQMAEMEKAMGGCTAAFDQGNADKLADCFDPEIVLYTPSGEFRGRDQVMKYLSSRYLSFAPHLHYSEQVHDVKSFGDALWYSYDYKIETPKESISGHGMAMCRKQEGQWRMLNMHNSLLQPDAEPKR
jgi:hypothetical protein